jgi:phage gpG-like protein
MATFKSVQDFFKSLDNDFARKAVPRIIAETATEYFKQRFSTKEWDGNPWDDVKTPVRRGSLMLRSGKLVNSIRPKEVNPNRVVISAGSSRVPYAKAHNEGETITIPVTDKMRKYAWAMHYKTGKQKKNKGNADKWKGLALTKKKSLTVRMPKRQYMGQSVRLNQRIMQRITAHFNSLFK